MKNVIKVSGLDISDIDISKGTVLLTVDDPTPHQIENLNYYGFHTFRTEDGKFLAVVETDFDPLYG